MILAINTCVPQYSLALAREDGAIVWELYLAGGEKNFRTLAPNLKKALQDLGMELSSINYILVSKGPGRFTGLKVGLSFAKGLSYILSKGVLGIDSLDALAQQVPYINTDLAVILDSRKDEYFMAIFGPDQDQRPTRKTGNLVIRTDNLSKIVQRPTLFLGNDLGLQGPIIKKELGEKAILLPSQFWAFRASSLFPLGLELISKDAPSYPELLKAEYMRDVEIKIA